MDLNFTPKGWEEYLAWQIQDKKTLRKINLLLTDIVRKPFSGIGKPEQLTGNLLGFWSRRIDTKNRLVYKVVNDRCEIYQCKGHYNDK